VELPAWLLAVSVPGGALLGVLLTLVVTRKNAQEANRTAQQETLTETLRWAAELAVSENEAEARLGVLELVKLGEDPTITGREQDLIDAALEAAQYQDKLALTVAESDADVIFSDEDVTFLDEDGIVAPPAEKEAP